MRWILSLLTLALSIGIVVTLNCDIKGVDYMIGLIAGLLISAIHVVLKIGSSIVEMHRTMQEWKDLMHESLRTIYLTAPGHSIVPRLREALEINPEEPRNDE